MRVVIAPDSFKGTLTALEVAVEIESGWKERLPHSICDLVPLADGGEGTVAALTDATGGSIVEVEVDGPYGQPTTAGFGLLVGSSARGKRAVIEMAAASGLHLRTDETRMSPNDASTEGTGQLIADALDRGVDHIILGLGGSATNDGGVGMLRALGARFLDGEGLELPPGGRALRHLESIDTSELHPGLARCRFEVACDVDNPLCGPVGASATFGPQKGATATDVAALDRALGRLADVARAHGLGDSADTPGAGAAGGVGFAALTFLAADLRPGIELVMEAVDLPRLLRAADLLITGEGQIDRQTLGGKAPFGAMRAADEFGVPTVAIVGCVGPGAEEVLDAGMTAIFGIASPPSEALSVLEVSRANLRRTARSVAGLWVAAGD